MSWIIAVDFGTAFSGYAYSLTLNKREIKRVKQWEGRPGLHTPKTPTCILFDENQELVDFGYKARDQYFQMCQETSNYYFFKDFKMELYGKKVSKDLVIKDVKKKPMSALTVFSEALRFLKEDALETISKDQSGFEFTASDFTWVLTVPAIWDVSARQFMREAAVQAGIVSIYSEDNLVIALEPEAASICCKHLTPEEFMMDDGPVNIDLCPRTQYIVVDCGGGTIDITVHEVLEGGAFKELHKASGNDKGGRTVDKKFTQCMRQIFCNGLWEEYEKDHPKEALQFTEDFVNLSKADNTQARFIDLYEEFKELVLAKKKQNEDVFKPTDGISFHWSEQLKSDKTSYVAKLEISEKKMESFFHESLVHLTDILNDILEKHSGIKYIMLVGGFSSSYVLRKHIRKEFSDQAKVMCPKIPQEAIVRGAMMFGCDQSVIRSRKSAFTYGVKVAAMFDPSKHKTEKMCINPHGDYCKDVFSKLVEIDEDVGWNKTIDYHFRPVVGDQKSGKLTFYRTERKNATYVDEWGVEGPVATCVVDMPDVKKGTGRLVKLKISFGATEITAVATDVESQSKVSAKMNFITQGFS